MSSRKIDPRADGGKPGHGGQGETERDSAVSVQDSNMTPPESQLVTPHQQYDLAHTRPKRCGRRYCGQYRNR